MKKFTFFRSLITSQNLLQKKNINLVLIFIFYTVIIFKFFSSWISSDIFLTWIYCILAFSFTIFILFNYNKFILSNNFKLMEGIGLIFIIYILTSGYLEISLLFIKELFNHISQNIDKLEEAKNNFIQIILNINYKSFPSLESYYNFLDSLTLLEEAAFLHILYIFIVLSIIYNIYSTIFANEIIKYFKLEEKYPKLNKIFKLRLQFQRYNLIFNLLWLLSLSLFILGLDVMVFGMHFIS